MPPMGEFDLIARYFARPGPTAGATVALGIGDDCAVLTPAPGHQWLVSTDMLVEGRHFLSTVSPRRLGHKALAVNLSDLAASGGDPRACFLSLALPKVDETFLAVSPKVCSRWRMRTAWCWPAATPRPAR